MLIPFFSSNHFIFWCQKLRWYKGRVSICVLSPYSIFSVWGLIDWIPKKHNLSKERFHDYAKKLAKQKAPPLDHPASRPAKGNCEPFQVAENSIEQLG